MVFHYLDIFWSSWSAKEIAEMKEHYQCMVLVMWRRNAIYSEILERELGPIRERRIEFTQDMGEVYNMLQKEAKKLARLQDKSEVKRLMGLIIFK